ncbi:MAG: hypothetical protein ACKO0M_10755 [Cyanobium sp.]
MACPFCGGRLLSKTRDRPPRLICAGCGGVQPQTSQPSLLGLLDRQAPGLLILLLMVLMPMLLLAVSPWLQGETSRRGARLERRTPRINHQRWDPRTGVVGRPSAPQRRGE